MAKLIWITGLSGSGKTTIGKEVYKKIKEKSINTIFLDGDSFREVLGGDLGYTQKDRFENAKRIHRMCLFLVSQEINVVCATMSLFKEIHSLNRDKIEDYTEIFIECKIEELIKRDQKGLYSKALQGNIDNIIGINGLFDKPINCELTIDNSKQNNLDKKVKKVLKLIYKRI